MAKPGPKPTPTHLKLIRGDRKSRVNEAEPKASQKAPPMPRWMSADAKKVWRRTVKQLEKMGVLYECDGDTLAAYCEAVVRHAEACQLIHQTGLLVKGRRDGIVKNPAIQVARDAEATIKALAQEFGLTPSARTRIKVDGDGTDDLDTILG
jgi:P27 family predicted phage terminase small subunit